MKKYKYNPLFENAGSGAVHFTVGTVIKSSIETVWDNVCKAENVKKYFTTDARRDLDKGGEVLWAWNEEGALINVLEVFPLQKIVFEWNGYKVDYKVKTEFLFEVNGTKVTLKIKESGWYMDDEGVKSALANCSGWTEFLSALKVFTEYKISYLHK